MPPRHLITYGPGRDTYDVSCLSDGAASDLLASARRLHALELADELESRDSIPSDIPYRTAAIQLFDANEGIENPDTGLRRAWRPQEGVRIGTAEELASELAAQALALRVSYSRTRNALDLELTRLHAQLEAIGGTLRPATHVVVLASEDTLQILGEVPAAALGPLKTRYIPALVGCGDIRYAVIFESPVAMGAWCAGEDCPGPWVRPEPAAVESAHSLAAGAVEDADRDDLRRRAPASAAVEPYAVLRALVANWCTGLPAC